MPSVIAFEPDYNKEHQEVLRALAEGIPGCEVRTLGEYVECDIAVIFGGYKYAFSKTLPKKEILEKHQGRRLLMVEAAFLKRGEYYQVGWGGFAGDADFNLKDDSLDRWLSFNHPISEWQKNNDGHIVVMGQLGRDVQVQDVDHYGWVRDTVKRLQEMGENVIFKPHPKEKDPSVYGVDSKLIYAGSMPEALTNAKSVVTWNSTSAVDAILYGIPAVTMHESSIAWPVSGHTLKQAINPVYPSRFNWLSMLGYAQWTLDEMRSGLTWEHLSR